MTFVDPRNLTGQPSRPSDLRFVDADGEPCPTAHARHVLVDLAPRPAEQLHTGWWPCAWPPTRSGCRATGGPEAVVAKP